MDIEYNILPAEQHGDTRCLWEEVFQEDTQKFLDYYYRFKTSNNTIYVAKHEADICAMLQLNPYVLKIGEMETICEYIIGVATLPQFRKRGIMASLLKQAMQAMYNKRQPFTFLMPAAEAIYRPFDFRYIYNQPQCNVIGAIPDEDFWIKDAKKEDCNYIARFAEKLIALRHVVYAVRNESYYECMLEEQLSQDGGILMFGHGDKMTGVVSYAKGESYELREPLMRKDAVKDLNGVVHALTGDETTVIACGGFSLNSEKKPLIMARILHLGSMFVGLKAKEKIECTIRIKDDIIDENNGVFYINGIQKVGISIEKLQTETDADAISIAALASYIFGYKTLESALQEEGDRISNYTKIELEKIIPFRSVFLNEVV